MNQTTKPVSSRHYRQQQLLAQRLMDDFPGGQHLDAARSITEELEAAFLTAWGFVSDFHGRALDVKMMAAKTSSAFDHCTWYRDPATNGHVVVAQPYLRPAEAAESIAQALTVSDQLKPEIIAAPEWAFYYPGHATLIVVKIFPEFENVLKYLDRLWSPGTERILSNN